MKHANLSITRKKKRKKERKKETDYKTIIKKKKRKKTILSKTFRSRSTIFQFSRPFSPSLPYFTRLSLSFVFWIHRKNIALVTSKRCIRAVIMRYAARVKREKREGGRKKGKKNTGRKKNARGKAQKSFARAVKYRSALKRIKTHRPSFSRKWIVRWLNRKK